MSKTLENDFPDPNKPPHGENARSGTQSIERVVLMLRIVASRGRAGMRIGEITATSGLPQSTCFRMLHRLEIEGLVARDPRTRKFYLGPLLHELGLLARPRYRLSELCDAALQKLAEVTQDTIYLSERSGLEAVCTHRALGDYPIKSLALDVGIRRPLGVGAGGLAILCALPPEEAESIIDTNAPKYEKYGFITAAYLREAIKVGREKGYAFLDSVVTPGTAAIGIAFPPDNPIAALSVAAISGRLESHRRDEVARLMRPQIRAICDAMSKSAFAAEM
ncbi:IclR family transcriptional regulator [Comamonas endophytica]|uniref:IclR family transcriptional regulator n=1 Tax=Comamonas endophytica TaxID=2949090 RepID=A0ABY6GEX7_9BURK|nr:MULTISPECIES: IclR family transcriptional regulator [unclassified Acidovorax]MCD2514344.1 IclR family transcriptional regulator [Acidovorax sp. D4N7]UYG53590.1 IclR family transcriptional regulator [Acidovorax sp. 5MLIR]UYG53637.1 IclR family transcriptional regulator [Acidovorax sp. 5MLIR]